MRNKKNNKGGGKIGVFTDDFYPIVGGQGRHLLEIYQRTYNNSRFEIFSTCKNDFKNHIQPYPEMSKFGKNILLSIRLNSDILRLIKEHNLTECHFHCGPGGLIITKKLPVPMICTVHHTYYQQQKYIPSQKWKYLLFLMERKMYRNADRLIAVSKDTKNVLVDKYKIPSKKIVVIPNGVDFKMFRKIKGITKIPNSLLFVGRLDKRKGIDFLIRSMPLVVKKIPNVKLFVIGKGKMREKLEKYVNEHGLKNNVEFLGFVPDKDLPLWYNRCQLTVVPSVFEGFGMNVLESLACGTPVIGTDTDGIRSILSRASLFEYGHTRSLVRIINRGLSPKNSAIISRSFYDWNKISKQTRRAY